MTVGAAEGGLILVVIVVLALLIVGLLGVGMIGTGMVMFLRNRGEPEVQVRSSGPRVVAEVPRGSAPRSGPLPANPAKASSGPKGAPPKSSGPKSPGPKPSQPPPAAEASEESPSFGALEDDPTVPPPAPPAYTPPARSDPPASFANPKSAPAPKEAGPSPFAADFLRIFDDEELEEHAATEVLVRKPGQMLFETSDPHGVPAKGTGTGSLPGKVVASKKS